MKDHLMSNITIDEARLWDSLMTHGKIGGTDDGGVCRQALTAEDREGRDLFCQWCRDAGLDITIDEVGNILPCDRGRIMLWHLSPLDRTSTPSRPVGNLMGSWVFWAAWK